MAKDRLWNPARLVTQPWVPFPANEEIKVPKVVTAPIAATATAEIAKWEERARIAEARAREAEAILRRVEADAKRVEAEATLRVLTNAKGLATAGR